MLNTLKLEEINPVINLTGVRLLVVFSLLLESPKTAAEINEYFQKNNYPKDIFSIDTLRNDLNALRNAGCNVTRADKSSSYKYTLLSHPFELDISTTDANNLSKIYNQYYKYIQISDLIKIEELFNVIANHTQDESVSEILRGISLLKNIDKSLIKSLVNAIERKHPVKFKYKAPYKGIVDYELIPEKFEFHSKKLYISGFLQTYNSSSFLPVSRIISPVIEKTQTPPVKKAIYTTIYELWNTAKYNFESSDNERIIDIKGDRIIIEYKTDSFFKITQKVLSYGSNCKVLAPEGAVTMIVNTLKKMKEIYKND